MPETSNSYTEINQDEELPSWGRAEGWKRAIRAASASASLADCASTVWLSNHLPHSPPLLTRTDPTNGIHARNRQVHDNISAGNRDDGHHNLRTGNTCAGNAVVMRTTHNFAFKIESITHSVVLETWGGCLMFKEGFYLHMLIVESLFN